MACNRALQLLLCLFCALISNCQGLESIDVLKPIAKISPAKINDDTLDDHFGYSVTAHQFFTNSSGMSLEDILNKTVIIVGAPHGKFPGGTDLKPDWRACQNSDCTLNETILMSLTSEDIKKCLENITSGLVYQCPIGVNECDGLLGNRDPASNDGLLFDRIGNYHCSFTGIKDFQAMGALIYSSGEYFIACAPLWTVDMGEKNPEGRCVYSNRSLMNFNLLRECDYREKFCSFGVGGHVKDGPEPVIGIGAPSSDERKGEVFYYQGSNSSAGSIKKNITTIFNEFDEYYGYFITSGFITKMDTKDYIVSVPRYADQNDTAGRVAVVTNVTEEPNLFIEGEQIGEYFGYSVTSVDLNGDGWDDLVVGAPFYWDRITPELGRVYIFYNDNGELNMSTVITGTVNGGRFGISVVNLGDLNNDGFEDVAISAPYEGSGVIYIYHGQEMDDMGSIINTTFQQRIEGSKIADQVTDVTSVSTFGFSLSGTTDVDQNTYRDLVVGAYESQNVFVLRSIPVAVADITITGPSDPIRFVYNCRDPNNKPIICFIVTVCTQYRGRGLDSGFSTRYKLEEVLETGQQNRLSFDPFFTTNSIIKSITFPGPNQEICDIVTAYVKNTTVRNVNDFYLRVELLQIPRDNSSVNTKFVPFDLSDSPIIDTTPPEPYNISIVLPCGDDQDCIADLALVVTSIDYKTVDNTPAEYSDRYVVGDATRVDIRVDLSNLGEDAFKSYITFVVNTDYLIFRQVVDNSMNVISCTNTAVNNTIYQNYTCNILSTISKLDVPKQIIIRLMGNTANLVGNEGTLALPIGFRIIEQQHNSENSSSLENNEVIANIVFGAVSKFEVIVLYTNVLNGSVSYTGVGPGNLKNSSSSLGTRINMQVTLQNKGKSNFNGVLDLYIPARGLEETYYYYYPASLSVQTPTNQSNLRCDTSSLNPDNFILDSTTRRKKRSFSDKIIANSLSRKKRQDTSYNLDCLTNPDRCLKVSCDVKNLGPNSVSYLITGYIDERFYNGKVDTFIFRAFATAEVTDGFTNSTGSINKANVTITLIKMLETEPGDVLSLINIIIIIICVVLAILFIIIFAIVLYFLGFFRRKRIQKEEEENADPYDDTYVPAAVDIDNKDEIKEKPQFFKEEPQSTKKMSPDTIEVPPSDNIETATEKVPSAQEESTI